MQILGVHHVSINVDDVAAARRFYEGVLGLTARTDRPDFSFGGAWLDAGVEQVHLIEGEVPPGLGQHFAFQVDDLDDAVATLRALGIDVTDPVGVAQNRQAFCSDPAGNRVELQQVG
jgi:catechol 2,3-dioxygenase-like lactoylglutathione lyase family enzyme